MYINDLSQNINCNIKHYANDTKLYSTVKEDNDISNTILIIFQINGNY